MTKICVNVAKHDPIVPLSLARTRIQHSAIQTPNPIFMTSEDSWLEFDFLTQKITLRKSASNLKIYKIFHFNSSQLLSCGQIKTNNFGVKDKL